MFSSSDQAGVEPFQGLTAKQCQVLDLLIEHRTSKEISRMLGISPHTVDQRIMLARTKLHASTRSEVAQAYRRLLVKTRKTADPDICDRSIYTDLRMWPCSTKPVMSGFGKTLMQPLRTIGWSSLTRREQHRFA